MRIRWTTPALHDLAGITEHIAKDNPEAAGRVIRRFEQSIEQLAVFPRSGRRVQRFSARQWVVPSTPYKLIYRIEGEEVLILSVLHSARR